MPFAARTLHSRDGEERKCRIRHVDVDDLREHVSRLRSCQRRCRPLLGDRRDKHVEVRPVNLQQALEMLHHRDSIDGRRRHQEVRRAKPRRRSVVQHQTIVTQHHAVTAASERERVPAVDVDTIQQLGSVLPLELDFAERGNVDDTDVHPHVLCFSIGRVLRRFAGARIRMRPFPQSRVHEARPVLDVPVMHRGIAGGLDVSAAFLSRECAQRHWRVRRPERRRSDLGNRSRGGSSEQRDPDDIARLALIGAHAERRVTLQMLDRSVALARGKLEIVDGDIGLQVDEAFIGGVARRHAP